jgi:hypothetical protein
MERLKEGLPPSRLRWSAASTRETEALPWSISGSIGSYRRAAWCALSEAGVIVGEGAVSADEDGLARLAIDRGVDVRAGSGADERRDLGSRHARRGRLDVQIAHARKVRDVAPLACIADSERVRDGRSAPTLVLRVDPG